jgi:heme-degrading monooxygenase HmoA
MIVCIRTVSVPRSWRRRYIAWIEEGRAIREQHGILGELIVRNSDDVLESRRAIEYVVITLWPSHEVFDAWIATPYRDALTASEVHQAVSYRPITRYDMVGGYVCLPGMARLFDEHSVGEEVDP